MVTLPRNREENTLTVKDKTAGLREGRDLLERDESLDQFPYSTLDCMFMPGIKDVNT